MNTDALTLPRHGVIAIEMLWVSAFPLYEPSLDTDVSPAALTAIRREIKRKYRRTGSRETQGEENKEGKN